MKEATLHQSQHAYRADRSTETALLELTGTIQKTLNEGETTCALLDVSGVVDNTSLERKRTAELTAGEQTMKIRSTRGTPQGGVCSLLMWSLVVDEQLNRLTAFGVHCIGYADDIAIIAKGKFEGIICELIQMSLRITSVWSYTVGLSINSPKTATVTFTRKRKISNMKDIRLDGTLVECISKVKYLGITLDKKLLRNRHITLTTNKVTRALMICRNLADKTLGCNPNIL
ncbi:hypothetical protein Trydic_g13409 [Trypoxylus dichotomus]